MTQVTYSPALDGPSNTHPQGVHQNSQIAQNGEGVLINRVLWFRIEIDTNAWGYLSFEHLYITLRRDSRTLMKVHSIFGF